MRAPAFDPSRLKPTRDKNSLLLPLSFLLLLILHNQEVRSKTIQVLSINAIEKKTSSGQQTNNTSITLEPEEASKYISRSTAAASEQTRRPEEASEGSRRETESREAEEEEDDSNEALGVTHCVDVDCEDLSNGDVGQGKKLTDLERLVELQNELQERVRSRLKLASRSSMELFEKLSLSGGCSASLMNLMSSLSQAKSFAVKFLDSSAKLPSGLMEGILSDLGDFDQCLSIRARAAVELEEEALEGTYSGKYCLLSARPNYFVRLENNSQTPPEGIQADGILWDDIVRNYWTRNATKGFQLAVCVPSRCSDDDIGQIYSQLASEHNFLGQIVTCQDGLQLKSQRQPDALQTGIIYTFLFQFGLVLAATLIVNCDNRTHEPEVNPEGKRSQRGWRGLQSLIICQLLACFSLSRSWKEFIGGEAREQSQKERGRSDQPSGSSESVAMETGRNPPDKTSKMVEEETNRLCRELTIRIEEENCLAGSGELAQDRLSHLDGLRLLVFLWIAAGHSFLYPSANNYQHFRSLRNMNIRDSLWFAATNFTLGIDMLLYMSGLLFVYESAGSEQSAPAPKEFSTVKQKTSTLGELGKLLGALARRILCFWPAYSALIGLAILAPLLADGPMWPEMVSRRVGETCRRNWWSNLLFLNNYFLPEDQLCLPSSWFVSLLMQLFLVASLLLLLIRKCSVKAGVLAISALLICSTNLVFWKAYTENLRAPALKLDESFVLDIDERVFRMYTSLPSSLGPFLVGMLGGLQFTASVKSSGSKPAGRKSGIGKLCQLIWSLLTALLALLVLSAVFHHEYSKLAAAIYWSCHRVGWALFTGFLIHQCALNRWLRIKKLLSLSSFRPLSKLFFVAYLAHPVLIYLHTGLVRDGLHVNLYNLLSTYVSRLFFTFAAALLVQLFVALPLCSLQNILLERWVRGDNAALPEGALTSSKTVRFFPLLMVNNSIHLDKNMKANYKDDLSRENSSMQLLKSKLVEEHETLSRELSDFHQEAQSEVNKHEQKN